MKYECIRFSIWKHFHIDILYFLLHYFHFDSWLPFTVALPRLSGCRACNALKTLSVAILLTSSCTHIISLYIFLHSLHSFSASTSEFHTHAWKHRVMQPSYFLCHFIADLHFYRMASWSFSAAYIRTLPLNADRRMLIFYFAELLCSSNASPADQRFIIQI